MNKIWTAVDFNLSRNLQGKIHVENVSIPQDLQIQIIVELDQVLYDKISRNPTWLQKLQHVAKAKADKTVEVMKGIILKTDATAGFYSRRDHEIFNKKLRQTLYLQLRKSGDEMVRECSKLIEEFKRGQKGLTWFRFKTSCKIGASVIVTAGSVALSVLTAGSLSPLGIVSVVKSGVSISQECVKLASSADKVAKLINFELMTLKKIMNENLAKASTGRKITQGITEVGLNVASRVIGLETPSIRNCEAHIKLHKIDIAKLDKKSKALSEKIYKAMDLQEQFNKKFIQAKRNLPAPMVGKIKISLEQSEKALDTLIKNTIKINESVEKANERQVSYKSAIDKMKQGLPDSLKYIDFALSLGVDIALGIADASSAIEKVSGSIYTAVTSIQTECIDNIG